MAELEAAAKRLDQSEGGKSALVEQVYVVIVSPTNSWIAEHYIHGPPFGC